MHSIHSRSTDRRFVALVAVCARETHAKRREENLKWREVNCIHLFGFKVCVRCCMRMAERQWRQWRRHSSTTVFFVKVARKQVCWFRFLFAVFASFIRSLYIMRCSCYYYHPVCFVRTNTLMALLALGTWCSNGLFPFGNCVCCVFFFSFAFKQTHTRMLCKWHNDENEQKSERQIVRVDIISINFCAYICGLGLRAQSTRQTWNGKRIAREITFRWW